jgi:signal transduction histidine kinase
VRWLSARGKLIRDAHGAPQRLVGICTDVTEQQRTEEGMRLLAEASAILVSSLDYDETLGNVARLAVSSLADYCIIDLLESTAPGGVRRVATAHANPAREALLAEVRNFPPSLDSDGIVARVLRTGVPELVSPIVDLAHEASAEARPGHRAVLAQLKPEAVMCVPLVARGATLGTLTCAFAESGRRYDDAHLALATELATRAALAVDNARLHRGLVESREQLERQVEETQAANRAKSEFLAVMSHELRTPLNAIGGYTQLMEMEIHGPVTPEQREDLARIQRSQLHLLSLINDVLNYAKLEAGKVQYHIAPLRLQDALAGVEALVAPQLASKSLRFTYEPPAPELMVRSDAEKLRQILLNLLSNAVKYTPAGGAVRLYTRVEDGRALVSIQDTGTGIHADKLELIFEPFVQLSREPMGVSEGTGLGLAISRELARAMGGDLTAESVPGQGSTFTVIVPR